MVKEADGSDQVAAGKLNGVGYRRKQGRTYVKRLDQVYVDSLPEGSN